MSKVGKQLSFLTAYVGINFRTALEYRAAFWSRIFAMLANDCMWLWYWWIYFTRFPVVQGWERNDVMALWAFVGVFFGLQATVAGGANGLAASIRQGNMDFYLALPKNALLHALVSKMDITAIGDIAFGLAIYGIFCHVTFGGLIVFLGAAVFAAVLFIGFQVIMGSLAFFIGNSEGLAQQAWNAFIHFSTYPSGIFRGVTKVLLYTLLPAGFINAVPVRLIRNFDPLYFLTLALVSCAIFAIGWVVFFAGLRRYESGNLMTVRM